MAEVTDQIKGKNAVELRELMVAKSNELKSLFDANTKDGKHDFTTAQIEEIKSRNDELTAIGKAFDTKRELEAIESSAKANIDRLAGEANRPAVPTGGDPNRKADEGGQLTVGQRFIRSEAYLNMIKSGGRKELTLDMADMAFDNMKTTMTTAAGFAPANFRTDIVVPYATAPITIQDIIPSVTTDLDAVKFMEETTFTNNAAGAAENAALAESAMAYTERTQSVELIGTYLPVTEQQLEIAESVRAIIDQRLMLMYLLKEQSDIITGNGSTPNLLGFLNKPSIQTQAKGADPVPDAIYKLFTKLRGGGGSGYVEPSAVVMHPNDWQDIRILRDANGNYIWGQPSDPGPERVWGKPIVLTTAITENTALSGDFQMFSQLWRKRGARIDVGFQSDDFIKNKLTLKVTGRLALVIYRAAAFGTVTGI